ncbi:MAG TPA: zinc-ribbon and DUF3426 domain-containing protein [Albitalea sp.]|nr:zinc-ribbon and DUF3426 domain-containing protein [Albitalea sp.]
MATRCVACGTIFRVVEDQLRVSEGWVRCGRCDEVFNALEGLFDLERESPPPWHPGMTQASQRDTTFQKTAADLDEEDRIASRFFRPEQDDTDKTPAQAVRKRDRVDFADAEYNPELLSEEDVGVAPATDPAAILSKHKTPKPGAPGFVRHAERAARWHTPGMRWSLSVALLLLAAGLVLQVGHHFRDLAAAQWPALRPALAAWCEIAQCRIEAPRRIDDVTVESSALTRAANGTDSFRLSITLRNRGALPVRMPSIDLSLTDVSGQLIARRALSPADLRVASGVLQPGSDTPLQVLLTAGTPRVAGYTVEVFYP